MRLSGYPSSRHACLTGASFISFATLSNSRKSIAIALITRPVQSFHLGTGSVRTADSINLPSFDRKLGSGLSILIVSAQPALYLHVERGTWNSTSLFLFLKSDLLNQNRQYG